MEKMHPASFTPTPRTKLKKKLLKQSESSRTSLIRPNPRFLLLLTTLVRSAQTFKSWRASTFKSKVKCKTTTSSWTRLHWLKLTIVWSSSNSASPWNKSKCKMHMAVFRTLSDNFRRSKARLVRPRTKSNTNYSVSKMNKMTSSLFKFSSNSRLKWDMLCVERMEWPIRGIRDSPWSTDFKTTSTTQLLSDQLLSALVRFQMRWTSLWSSLHSIGREKWRDDQHTLRDH